ncbi:MULTISPECIES: resistance to Congo red protein [Sporosarcina]|nr:MULTISPECIES: resistance to Congo red protein [Sporosarcina]
MATQTGWIFLIVILLLMALFAVSVIVSARRQRDPDFFTEDDNS